MSCHKKIEMEYFQGRLLVEIVWPLLLFLILFLVRLRGLKKNHHECRRLLFWFSSSHTLLISYRLFRGEGNALSRIHSIRTEFHLHL